MTATKTSRMISRARSWPAVGAPATIPTKHALNRNRRAISHHRAGVAPGSGGTTTLTVTPGATSGNTGTISVVGTNGFSGIVDLTCSVTTKLTGVAHMPICSLNPASVTISGAAAQTSTLTVNTTAASSAENQKRSILWPSAGATLALALLFVMPRKRKDCIAIGVLLLFISTGLIACGGGNGGSGGGGGGGGTTPGAYTITVTGTSGSVSAPVGTVALTVQ